MNANTLRSRRGFSLIEITIALVLTSVVFAGVWQFFASSTRTTTQAARSNRAKMSALRAMEVLYHDIPPARRVSQPGEVSFGIYPMPEMSYNSVSGNMDKPDSLSDAVRIVVPVWFDGESVKLISGMASKSSDITVSVAGIAAPTLWVIVGDEIVGGELPSDLFKVTSVSGNVLSHSPDPPYNPTNELSTAYKANAPIYPVSVVEFGIDRANASKPILVRRINNGSWSPVAQGIRELKIYYRAHNGTYDPITGQPNFVPLVACGISATICRDPGNGNPLSDPIMGNLYDVKIRIIAVAAKEDGGEDEFLIERTAILKNFSFGMVSR